ncbi:MAG: zinc ABC transporter substrate-binding protein [Planctomycetes bacterium]|nr:zinc ABC transporter substrate-binding protein [Planctomycetota bacterium]
MKRPRNAAILLCLLGVAGLAVWSGCGSLPDGWDDQPGPPRVLVSFPPLYSFVKNVGGDQAGVICLCTDTGPHEYEFNPNQTIKLKRADLFFANGLRLDDHFTDKMVDGTSNKKLLYRKLGDTLPAALRKKKEEEAGKHDEDGHHHGAFDPHVWLGIPQAISMVERIRDDLKKVDSSHAALYDKTAKDYIARLEKLHHDGREKLKGLKNVPVITFHESMDYFADSFGLNVIGSIHPDTGVEQNPNITALIKKCAALPKEKKRLVLIAVEPQYPEKAAEILKKQIEDPKKTGIEKVVIVTIDPLETCSNDDLSADWYVKRMEKNLDTLAKSAK